MRSSALALTLLAMIAAAAPAAEWQTSDYEIATARRALERARGDFDRIAPHLNLGDLHASRAESAAARANYEAALDAARAAAIDAYERGDLDRYARATAWAGLALAKLEKPTDAIRALDESLRYLADDPKIWNLYASAMDVLDLHREALATARNAVALAATEAARDRTTASRLDLAIYRYTLASALLDEDRASAEGGALLETITATLEGREFESLRREIRDSETFEVFSTARGDAEAWLTLRNRALLRLGAFHEETGDAAAARGAYERVLERRSDDPSALAGLARLGRTPEERERWYTEAFAANPYAVALVLSYETFLAGDGGSTPPLGDSPVQRALRHLASGEVHAADRALAAVPPARRATPAVRYVSAVIALEDGRFDDAADIARELDPESAAASRIEARRHRATRLASGAESLLAAAGEGVVRDPDPDRLLLLAQQLGSPNALALRRTLAEAVFSVRAEVGAAIGATSEATVLDGAKLGDIELRFQPPAAFRGSFPPGAYRLEFRLLGEAEGDLVVEPIRLEAP